MANEFHSESVTWRLAIPVFRLALTGDFLNAAGSVAYGDAGLGVLSQQPEIRPHFIKELAPHADDPGYWARLYSLKVSPAHIQDVDGLIVLRPWVQKSTFAAGAGDLCVIGRSGAGYDKIDLAACTENGVAVFNAPLALNHSTASSALLFMLALAKRLFEQDRTTRQGRWDRQAEVLGHEISGRTLGIIGLGHSGRELVRLVAPFAMRVIAFSPHADPEQASALGVRLTSLEEVMSQSDFVSLHCKLTQATRGMITAAQLALMKSSAYLINVGRGELVEQRCALRIAPRSQDRRRRPGRLRGRAAAPGRPADRPRQRDPDASLVGIDVGRLASDRPGDGKRNDPSLPRRNPGERSQPGGARCLALPREAGKVRREFLRMTEFKDLMPVGSAIADHPQADKCEFVRRRVHRCGPCSSVSARSPRKGMMKRKRSTAREEIP